MHSSDPESAAAPSSWWRVTGKQAYRRIVMRRWIRGARFSLRGRCTTARHANPIPAVCLNFSGRAEKMELSPPPPLSPGLPLLVTHSPTGEASHQRALPRHSCAHLPWGRAKERLPRFSSANIWICSRRQKHEEEEKKHCVRAQRSVCLLVCFIYLFMYVFVYLSHSPLFVFILCINRVIFTFKLQIFIYFQCGDNSKAKYDSNN